MYDFSIVSLSLSLPGILGIVFSAVLMIVLVVLLILFLPRRNCKRFVENSLKTYEDGHHLLIPGCETDLKRLKTLSENSQEFIEIYQKNNSEYEYIYSSIDKPCAKAIDDLKKYLFEKDYKSIRKVKEQIREDLNKFTARVKNLEKKLKMELSEDTHTLEYGVFAKKKYREIKEFYEEHKNELSTAGESFEIILERADDLLELFQQKSDSGKFQEATEAINELTKILDAMLAVMSDLPGLILMVNQIIPEKQKKMDDEYNKMIREGYILSHLDVAALDQRIQQSTNHMREQMKLLNVKNIKIESQELQGEIMDMMSKFAEEREARSDFDHSQTQLIDSTFMMEKRYSELMKRISEYQKTFVLNSKYIDQMYNLKEHIETIGYMKRNLDSYLDTSDKRPYTVITKQMREIDEAMKKTERTMNDYIAYIKSLKEESNEIYKGARERYLKLLDYQNKLNEIYVDAYTQKITPHFLKAYRDAGQILEIVETCPVNVQQAKNEYNEFILTTDKLISSVDNIAKMAEEAEIVHINANAFLGKYEECDSMIQQSEILFYSGNFPGSKESASNVIKTFDPTYAQKR